MEDLRYTLLDTNTPYSSPFQARHFRACAPAVTYLLSTSSRIAPPFVPSIGANNFASSDYYGPFTFIVSSSPSNSIVYLRHVLAQVDVSNVISRRGKKQKFSYSMLFDSTSVSSYFSTIYKTFEDNSPSCFRWNNYRGIRVLSKLRSIPYKSKKENNTWLAWLKQHV